MEKSLVPVSIRLGRFRRLPRRASHVWQGGIVRMPMWVDSPSGGPPSRPWGAVWVAMPDGLIGMELAESEEKPGAEFAVGALVDLALRYQDQLLGRPGTIQVVDAKFGETVAAALGDPGVRVEVIDDLVDVTRMLNDFAEDTAVAEGVPALMETSGVTLDDVRALADATERFIRAEPWQFLSNEDLVGVEMTDLDRRAAFAVVMGHAGFQRGLAFFSAPGDVDRFLTGVQRGRPAKTHWAVMLSHAHEIPLSDLCLWDRHDLPLAGAEGYPCPIGYTPKGEPVRPPAKLLRQMTAVLAALAASTEAQIDSGRWVVSVSRGDRGTLDVTLSLPDLLDAEPLSTRAPGRGPDRRANERLQAEIGRFLQGRQFENLDEVNAAVHAQFTGRRLDQFASTATSAIDRAQDLVYEAFDAVGRRRVKLAREALALSPDCADAYVVLAEAAAEPERALALYESGVEAGERAIGADRFAAGVGQFWGILETRPFMRAQCGAAQTLADLGRTDEAVSRFRELLRLNPNDNQGVRYLLLRELTYAKQDGDAVSLLQQYENDIAAEWVYTWALIEFRSGHPVEAAERLTTALEANRHVPGLIMADPSEMPPGGDTVRLGGEDEAESYVREFGDAWRETPAAIVWMLKAKRPKGTRSRARPRPPKRT